MPRSIKLPSIAFIVARSFPQHVIGCENALPWQLKTDLRFFKNVTQGHAVIMGRKTYDSIGRPLPNRLNVVISRSDGNRSSNLVWAGDRESALFLADIYSIMNDRTQVIIMGGEQIYEMFEDVVNKVFLTEVFATFDRGDAFFHNKFDLRRWRVLEERDYSASDGDEYPFRISVLERKLKTIRQCDLSDFMVRDASVSEWVGSQFIEKAERFERLPDEQFTLPMLAA